jgi:hypothetical protein
MRVRITKSRGGVSLIELLGLMSSCTIILTMSAVLLHRMMRVQIDTRAFVDIERNSSRLSQQFRQDVHQATAAMLGDSTLKGNVFLQLHLPPETTIEYSRLEGAISRNVSHSGKLTARDEFAFEQLDKVVVAEADSPKRIILTITNPLVEHAADKSEQLKSLKSVPVSLQVEAVMNREVASASSSNLGGQTK